jgi:hypothetical protein
MSLLTTFPINIHHDSSSLYIGGYRKVLSGSTNVVSVCNIYIG